MKEMMKKKGKDTSFIKIALDVLMALVFAVLFDKTVFGGMAFHEIAGLAIGGAIILHKILNWKWIKGVTKKLFSPGLPKRTVIAYIVDILLLCSVLTILVTGILMSKVVFTGLINVRANVKGLHQAVSYLSLLLLGVHMALAWGKVMSVFKKLTHVKKSQVAQITAILLAVAVLAVGTANIVSQGYFTKVAAVVSSFSQVEGGGEGKMIRQGDQGQNSAQSGSASGQSEGSTDQSGQTLQSQDQSSGQRQGPGQGLGEGRGQGQHDERGGSSGVIGAIYSNLSIMGAFTVVTYYLDKLLRRRKRAQPAAV